jgi:gamma-glutamyl phosphate reductase
MAYALGCMHSRIQSNAIVHHDVAPDNISSGNQNGTKHTEMIITAQLNKLVATLFCTRVDEEQVYGLCQIRYKKAILFVMDGMLQLSLVAKVIVK